MTAGSQAVFPGTARNLLLSLGGVIQEPDTNFTISGSTLTFTTAPVANTTFFAVIFGDMQSTGTPSDGTVLPASIASSGNFSFPQLTVTGTSSLGDDVTFTGANYNVLWDKSSNALEFADNAKATFGTGNDLEIFHNGSNSFLDSNTGNLYFRGSGGQLLFRPNNAEDALVLKPDGAVELYYDNSKKFETDTNGITVTGRVLASGTSNIGFAGLDNVKLSLGTSDDLRIHHDGSNSYIDNSTGALNIRSLGSGANVQIIADNDYMARFVNDGAVELYYDNAKKFETTSTGANVTSANDAVLKVTTTGTASTDDARIELITQESSFIIQNDRSLGTDGALTIGDGTDTYLQATKDAEIGLYFNNNKKFETTSNGISVTGSVIPTGNVNLGDSSNSNNNRFIAGASDDLQIYHDGSESVIGNSTGTFQFLSPNEIRYRATTHHFLSYGNDETMAKFIDDGAVELYFDNSKKFETITSGVTVTGDVNLTGELNMIAGSDGQRFFDARVGSSALTFRGTTGGDANHQELARFFRGGGCELNHNGTKRIFTESAGGAISGKSRFLGHSQGSGANSTEVHFNSDNSHIGIHFSGHGNTGNTYTAARMVINGTGGTYGTITYSLGGTGYNSQSSDSRSKKNIVEWTESELDKFKNLQPKLFHFDHNEDSDPKYKGYIAQDNLAAFPEAYPLVDDRYMFNPSGMVHYLMKAMQELVSKVEVLETEIAALKAA
jgi:hypothetical protein